MIGKSGSAISPQRLADERRFRNVHPHDIIVRAIAADAARLLAPHRGLGLLDARRTADQQQSVALLHLRFGDGRRIHVVLADSDDLHVGRQFGGEVADRPALARRFEGQLRNPHILRGRSNLGLSSAAIMVIRMIGPTTPNG